VLGHGEKFEGETIGHMQLVPKLVEYLSKRGKRVLYAVCGAYHTIAMTGSTLLFSAVLLAIHKD
jgi:hypothetical protein